MKVLIFNGGRGASRLIYFLNKIEDIELTSIVNTLDDGKSTGVIRNLFNMYGPSDIRKTHDSLLNSNHSNYSLFKKIFQSRFNLNKTSFLKLKLFVDNFEKKFLLGIDFTNFNKLHVFKNLLSKTLTKLNNQNIKDLSLINLIYAGAFIESNKSTYYSIKKVEKLFSIHNSVLPVTNENCYLSAIRENGRILYDEASIVEIRSNEVIKRIFITKKKLKRINETIPFFQKIKLIEKKSYFPILNSQLSKKISSCDLIIFGPGTQHSSLFPSYLTKGILKEMMKNPKCKKIFITNIGADYETPHFCSSDYIENATKYLNLGSKSNYKSSEIFDFNFININKKNLDRVYIDELTFNNGINNIVKNFESSISPGYHDPKKIYDIIKKII